MSKLTNLMGRINYISSYARQENLYSVYETTERKFWRELAKCNQEEFIKSGAGGKCIEARELIIALPESFVDYNSSRLLEVFTNHFKQNYGVECISALHHNKRKTNYHNHLIFSERKLLDEPIEKVAARNMFYNETGKHVRTKKEILDDSGQMRDECRIIPKGEVYERKLFTIKNSRFKSDSFLDEMKKSYTELINIYVRDDKEKLKVFDRKSAYLPMKKIGKNNPKAAQMEADNLQRKRWNQTVDRALLSGVPEQQIIEVRKVQIGRKASLSIQQSGGYPELFINIIEMAIKVLELLIIQLINLTRKFDVKANETQGKLETVLSVKQSDRLKEVEEVPEEEIPAKPKKSARATEYPRLEEIYVKLQQQNRAILQKEQRLGNQEMELHECKGIFKGKKRKELQGEIEQTKKQLELMKQRLTDIVTSCGYQNVRAFLVEHEKSRTEYAWYRQAVSDWKQTYGEGRETQTKSIRARLKKHEEQIKQRKGNPSSVQRRDRGAR
nr:MobA/MobL family protein [uncultured Blautia sp.]